MNPVRLLFVGDIHLGRRSGRLPAVLAESRDLTPAGAWARVVDEAIQLKVDAVVLAGDVVDDDNDRFEAFGPLERGVRRLVTAGIRVLGVAGNHDVAALPKLAKVIPDFQLLGQGKKWETTVIRDAVQIIGWSFSEKKVMQSPLDLGYSSVQVREDIPAFGLLHCELDKLGSHYAPVRLADLKQTGLDGWFLGHIHEPHDLTTSPYGYLGSLMGLDPTETGVHGPWLVTVDGQNLDIRQLPIAPLRWEKLLIDVESCPDGEDLLSFLAPALQSKAEQVKIAGGKHTAVGCRVTLTGKSKRARQLRDDCTKFELADFSPELDGAIYFLDKLECEVIEPIDLHSVANSDDPPGILAKQLIELESNTPAALDLIREARAEIIKVTAKNFMEVVDSNNIDDETVRNYLIRVGRNALEELLAQVADKEMRK